MTMRTSVRRPPVDGRRGSLTRHWSSLNGLLVHARVATAQHTRNRIPVVLVHGLGMSSNYMTPIARRLAEDFPVYAPDQPGFGASGKPEAVLSVPKLADFLAEWARAIGLQRFALLGNSLGCQIAAACAARHPTQVDRMVLQGPTVDRSRSEHTLPMILVRWLLNATREPSSLSAIPPATPSFEYTRAGLGRVIRTTRLMLENRIEEALPRVSAPTLVVRGSRDPIASQQWAEQVTRLLQDGRLVVVPGAAHTMNHHAALELARVVRPFLLGRYRNQTR